MVLHDRDRNISILEHLKSVFNKKYATLPHIHVHQTLDSEICECRYVELDNVRDNEPSIRFVLHQSLVFVEIDHLRNLNRAEVGLHSSSMMSRRIRKKNSFSYTSSKKDRSETLESTESFRRVTSSSTFTNSGITSVGFGVSGIGTENIFPIRCVR